MDVRAIAEPTQVRPSAFPWLSVRAVPVCAVELPLQLISGRIGRLELRVPWSRLRSEPVEMVLEDVMLEATLRDTPDADAYTRRRRVHKRLRLDASELLRGLRASAVEGGDASRSGAAPPESYLGRLGRAILDNLRLTLVRVHVRVENHVGAGAGAAAAGAAAAAGSAWGVTLERLEMSSTDREGLPEYQRASSDQPWLHKLVMLSGIGVYWQPATSSTAIAEAPAESTASPPAHDEHSIVLPPTDVSLLFRLLRAGASAPPQEPRARCHVRIEQRIDVRLTGQQCVQLLHVSSHLSSLAQRERYGRFRSQLVGDPAADGFAAAAWWRYAKDCVLGDVAAQRRWRGWSALRAHGDRRREYLPLWQQCLQGEEPTPETSERLLQLEEELDLNDILLFRRLAQLGVEPASPDSLLDPPLRGTSTMSRSASDNLLQQRRTFAAAPAAADDAAPPPVQRAYSGWRGWLWRGPYIRASSAGSAASGEVAASGEELDQAAGEHAPAAGDDDAEGTGYVPLSLSQQQQQQLRSWLDGAGVFSDESGVLFDGVRVAPTAWSLEVDIQAVRVRLFVSAPSWQPSKTTLRCATLELSKMHVGQSSDLEGSEASRLDIESFALSAQIDGPDEPNSQVLHPLLHPRSAAAQGSFAISVLHESWPAALGAWQGSLLRAGHEAGSQLSVSVLPLSAQALAPALIGLHQLVEKCSAASHAPSGSLLPEPLHNSTITAKLGASVVLFPHANGILQLDMGAADLELGVPEREARMLQSCMRSASSSSSSSSSSASGSSAALNGITSSSSSASGSFRNAPSPVVDEISQSMRLKLQVQTLSLRLRTSEGTGVLVEPASLQLVLNACQSTREDSQSLTVHVSRVAARVDISTQLPALLDVAAPWIAAWPAAATRDPPAVATSSRVAAARSMDFTCEGCSLRAECRASCGQVEAHDLRLSSFQGPAPEQSKESLTIHQLDAEWSTDNQSIYLHACVHDISLNSEKSELSPLDGSAGVESFRLSVTRESCSSEAFVLTCPVDSNERAVSVAATLQGGMLDVAVILQAWRACIADLNTCAAIVQSVASAVLQVQQLLFASWPSLAAAQTAKSNISSALALRCDLLGCLLEVSPDPNAAQVITWQLGSVCLTALRDRGGGQQLDVQLGGVSLTSKAGGTGAICYVLLPCSMSVGVIFPAAAGSVAVLALQAEAIAISLPEEQRMLLFDLYERVQAALPTPSPTPASSSPGIPFGDVSVHAVSLALDAGPVLLSGSDLSLRWRMQGAQMNAALMWECLSLHDTLRGYEVCRMASAAGSENGQPGHRVRFMTEIMPNGMYVDMGFPAFALLVRPSELDELLEAAAPLMRILASIELPAASDVPLTVDFAVDEAEIELAEACGAMRIRASANSRAAVAGGLYDPARARGIFSVQGMCVEMTSPSLHRVLLAPCSAGVRIHSGPRRMRAVAEVSDVHVQVSEEQFRLAEQLFAALAALPCLQRDAPMTPGYSDVSPVKHRSRRLSNELSVADSFSEASEYFDAREELEPDDIEGVIAPVMPEGRRDETPADVQCEARLGLLVVTLLDDSANGMGSPVLQLALETSRAAAWQTPVGELLLSCRMQLALHHYARELLRWEPVLASCRLDLTLDVLARKWGLTSSGPVELDINTRLLGSLLRLRRLAAAADAAENNEALTVAPFVLRNETGTPMCFWIDGSAANLVEVASGASAHLLEAPVHLAASGRRLHVLFQGFQQLDIRPDPPPYERRCRLWPAGERSAGSAIINVLVESREVNGTETCTLHSRFVLHNGTNTDARLCLVPKDATRASIDIRLEPQGRTPVPLACLHGSLVVAAAGAGGAGGTGDPLATRGAAAEEDRQLEISPAALEVLKGRGSVRLVGSVDGQADVCYLVKPSPTSRPPQGWLLSLHPPLLLHNALLCDLEFEIRAYDTNASTFGKVAAGTSVPWLGSASRVRVCSRCSGFGWSDFVEIDLTRASADDPDDDLEDEHSLTHPPSPASPASNHLHLCLRVSRGTGVTAEVSGRVWVVNECHIPLRCQVACLRPVETFIETLVQPAPLPAGPLPAGLEPPPLSSGAIPLAMGSQESLPDLMVRADGAPRRARAGAVLSLPDLLRLAANSEDMLLGVSVAELDRESGAAAAAPRLLQLGVKLLPLPQQLGSSFLLAISPRVMLLNRTGRPLLCCQRGCTAYAAQPCDDDNWMAVHWVNPQKPRELLLCRLDRGAEWSGGISLTATPMASGGSETTLRLRNLETGVVEFLRLSWHQLASRATSGLIVTRDASGLAAPITIQNDTGHTLTIKQTGVHDVVSTLRAGELLPYAWDEPARRKQLDLTVHASIGTLSFRYNVRHSLPRRVRRPPFAALLGHNCVEMYVAAEGVTTRITLRDASSPQPLPQAPPNPPARPVSPTLPSPMVVLGAPRSLSAPRPSKAGASASDVVAWHIRVQLPDMGLSLLDDGMRELLYLSLRGLRVELMRKLPGRAPVDSVSLALASVQLDCQLPRASASEEVLLQVGVAARGDAISAQVAITHDESDASLAVLQRAVVSLQEITLRIDEEAIETVAAALRSASETPGSTAAEAPGALATPWGGSPVALDIHAELADLRERLLLEVSQRLFVQQLRLGAIPLKLSLQRASRPDAASNADDSEGRWLRWLGFTLIGLDNVPIRMPEVAVQRALLPAGGLLQEVQQQYTRALWQQAYKLLPSASLLGDPYGMLRTLRQRFHKHRLVVRHAAWPHVPVAVLEGAADLLRASAASLLSATDKSARALSSSLEALLREQHLASPELGPLEAALIGVGGLAREAARSIEGHLQRINEAHHVPPQVQGVLAACLLPVGLWSGVQRLALLVTLASLTLMRSTADACRGFLLGPVKAETGRARAPRPADSPALYPMCAATALASASAGIDGSLNGSLVCAVLASPRGVLSLTSTTLRCAGPLLEWEMPLASMLLVQQRGRSVELLALAADGDSAIESRSLTLHCDDDAARLHEVLRLAGLNARGAVTSPISARPLIRATLLGERDDPPPG